MTEIGSRLFICPPSDGCRPSPPEVDRFPDAGMLKSSAESRDKIFAIIRPIISGLHAQRLTRDVSV